MSKQKRDTHGHFTEDPHSAKDIHGRYTAEPEVAKAEPPKAGLVMASNLSDYAKRHLTNIMGQDAMNGVAAHVTSQTTLTTPAFAAMENMVGQSTLSEIIACVAARTALGGKAKRDITHGFASIPVASEYISIVAGG